MFLHLLILHAATGELQGPGSSLLHSQRTREEETDETEFYYPEDEEFEHIGVLEAYRSLQSGNEQSKPHQSTEGYAAVLQTEHKLCTAPCKEGGPNRPVASWPEECFRFCSCSHPPGSRLRIIPRPPKGRYAIYFDTVQKAITRFPDDDLKDYRKDYDCPDGQHKSRLHEFDQYVPDPATKEENFFHFRFTEWTVTGNILPLLFVVYGGMILITVLCVLIYSKHQQRVREREYKNRDAARAKQDEQPLITLKPEKTEKPEEPAAAAAAAAAVNETVVKPNP